MLPSGVHKDASIKLNMQWKPSSLDRPLLDSSRRIMQFSSHWNALLRSFPLISRRFFASTITSDFRWLESPLMRESYGKSRQVSLLFMTMTISFISAATCARSALTTSTLMDATTPSEDWSTCWVWKCKSALNATIAVLTELDCLFLVMM